METLEARLGYTFQDRSLLQQALTHSSYANENRGGLGSNERLEFLGDSILGMVTADHLYHAHPDLPEGDLTRTRAALVCEESLVEVADAVEAVLAAVYLDGGLAEARKIVQRFILARETEKAVTRDYKTALQELVQRESGQVLAYRLIGQSGPDHAKVFTVEVDLNGKAVGRGTGHSKKEAEQMAARSAVEMLNK